MNSKFNLTILLLFFLSIFLTSCGSSYYRPSKAISKSHKESFQQYKRDIKSAMKNIEIGRSSKENKVLIDSAINAMILDKEFDTIYIFEECLPPSYIYYIAIWDRESSFFLAHRLDYFKKGSSLSLHYKLIDLISLWNPKKIICESNAHPLTYYENFDLFQVATRMIFQKQKLIDSQTIIFREINFDSSEIPGFLD